MHPGSPKPEANSKESPLKKLLIALLAATGALADEGMWMPQQMPRLAAELKAAGVTLDPARLADLTGDPMGAVVSLGGCTASFVSPDGLVVTNHHCAFGSLQHNSTAERDLIANGFLAKTRAEELPAAPGTKVWVTTNIEDVTARVNKGMKANISDVDRAMHIDRRQKELVAECEKTAGVRCRVSSFFEGSQYLRTTQAEISDVRLVYAPPNSVGDFGGEIDNFEWPRHTGDFSFYRAYVDGKPYHPKHWLKVAKEGVNDGDTVIVAGYPGRTFRYQTADEVRNQQEFIYPTSIRYYSEAIRLLEEQGKGNHEVELRNASRIRSMANSLKNYTSVQEGFVRDRIVDTRVRREEQLRASAPQLISELAKVTAEQQRTQRRDLILDWLTGKGSPMLQQAFTIVRLAGERPKKDIDRLSKYQEREWLSLGAASTRAQTTIDVASDRAVVLFLIEEASRLPPDQRIAALEGLDVARLYSATKVGDLNERTKMLAESTAQLKARKDPMLDLALALVPLYEEREVRETAAAGAMARLRPAYFDVLKKVSGGTVYPDANSTLRITFGRVTGYSPRDAIWHTPQSSLHGVVQKDTGKEPFDTPPALLAAAADERKTRPYVDPELKDVPVNFLSTCDTTGGNSGSPTLNAKGELVGLLFDGNYESIDADFLFNPPLTRSIHVDTQYMLWYMDAVDGADELLREMGVVPKM
jgi:hypothetical protein